MINGYAKERVEWELGRWLKESIEARGAMRTKIQSTNVPIAMWVCGTHVVILCLDNKINSTVHQSIIRPGKHRVRLLIRAYFIFENRVWQYGHGTYDVMLCPDHKINTTNRFYDLENIGLDYSFVHTLLLQFSLK